MISIHFATYKGSYTFPSFSKIVFVECKEGLVMGSLTCSQDLCKPVSICFEIRKHISPFCQIFFCNEFFIENIFVCDGSEYTFCYPRLFWNVLVADSF